MPTTTRWGLRYPEMTDDANIPEDIGNLAQDLDGVAMDDYGLLAARPTSSGGSPGKPGRYYYATDLDKLYRDYGTGWKEIILGTHSALTDQRVPTDGSVTNAKVSNSAAIHYSKLDLVGAVLGSDITDGTITADKLSTSVLDMLASEGLQEGVMGSGEGLVTWIDANTLRVAAGTGWVYGDGTVGNGLYLTKWNQTDVNVPSASSGKGRLDRIVIPASIDGDLAVPYLVQGSEVPHVNAGHNGLGIAAVPSGAMNVGHAVSRDTGVANDTNANTGGLRDMRTWARGARFIVQRTANASATDDYTTTSTSSTPIDSTNMRAALILSGAPIRVKLTGVCHVDTANKWVEFSGTYGGTHTHRSATAGAENGGVLLESLHPSPTAGFQTFSLQWKTESGCTATVRARSSYPLTWEIKEEIQPSAQNVYY